MGKDCQSSSSRKLTFCLSNHLASLTNMSGTGCVITTLNPYNFIVQALHQIHGSAND